MNRWPDTMICIEITEPGGPEVLQPVRRPVPEPGAGDVLIEVRAAGVNRPDVMQRQGMYPPPPGAPDIPGLEIAGTVAARGAGVDCPAVGDDVCALVTGGGYAQYCLAPAPLCLPVPRGMDFVQAAGIPETFFTVWTNVFDRGRLGKGERVLVHGGSSGIGTTAIQMIKNAGAHVYVTAGTPEKCEACLDLGADAAINYRNNDFVGEIKDLTDGRGVDLILDMVGGDYFPRNLNCLAVEGRLVQIALQRGPKSEVSLLRIMLNRLTVTGSTLRPRGIAEKSAIAESLKREIWPGLESGKLKPVIHARFPLEQAGDAHRLMDSHEHIGKIILTNEQ
ncbi:MAG: NAD(P)H-quinone oxidoreductase [Gammaproteobacteria bacterium]|nr:NAD(P)H-quinone oxidoreductase [Gammaproteobacteria bacterium]